MSGMIDVTDPTPTTAAVQVFSEDHTGDVVGGVITLDYPYAPGTVRLYIQGVRLRPGADNDYLETQPTLGQVTLLDMWSEVGPSDVILVDYNRVV